MKKLIATIVFSLALCGSAFPQSQFGLDKVKEIKLLETDRDEVLKILRSYESEPEEKYHHDWFTTEKAKINVQYSKGNCEEFIIDGFRVSEWKAIYISIEPNDPVKAKDLKINLSKYKKERKYHDVDDFYVYHDKEAGIIFTVSDGKIITIEFVPSPKNYDLMCAQEKAAKLRATTSIFDEPLNERSGIIACPVASVTEVYLNQTTVTSCDSSAQSWVEGSQMIHVQTLAVDPEGDVLSYIYTVSAGKIIGAGEKVVWDLSGVKPGTYTITAAVDDGCGVCGTTQTKAITVK